MPSESSFVWGFTSYWSAQPLKDDKDQSGASNALASCPLWPSVVCQKYHASRLCSPYSLSRTYDFRRGSCVAASREDQRSALETGPLSECTTVYPVSYFPGSEKTLTLCAAINSARGRTDTYPNQSLGREQNFVLLFPSHYARYLTRAGV